MKQKQPNHMIAFGIHTVEMLINHPASNIKEVLIAESKNNPKIAKLIKQAEQKQLPIHSLSKHELSGFCQSEQHQGIAISYTRQTIHESDLTNLIEHASDTSLILILDCIQDPHNLGACIRSANAAGVLAVIIPKDKSAPLNATVEKVACGGLAHTPVIPVTNISRTIEALQAAQFFVMGLAGEAETSIYQADLTGKIALVMGSEEKGIRPLVRKHCDELIKIPMHGQVESLNVSVATGICLFEVLRQQID